MNKSRNRLKLWFDRLLSKSLWKQFATLGVILIGLFLLSWLFLNLSGCRWKDFALKSKAPEWLLPLYLLIDTNAFNNLYINGVHGWALIVSSVTFIIGAFIFNGAIIGIITNFIDQRVSKYRDGQIYYLKSGHHIIMGYDDMVPSIITSIFERDKDAFILLLSAVKSEILREKLEKVFNESQMERIIINYGHRTSARCYKDIHLETAEQVYIVGLRGLDGSDASKDTMPMSDEEADILAIVEHNRWNVEKLLMGFRKARKEEDKYCASNEEMETILKKNKKLFIHHDIRPFNDLDDIKELDREFARYIPWIIRMTVGR